MAAAIAALTISTAAEARNLRNETLNISSATPIDFYNVGWPSNLISDGVTTDQVSVGPSDTFTASLTTTTSATDTAISVGGGKATIVDSTITSTRGAGVAASSTQISTGNDGGRHKTPGATIARSDARGTFAGATLAGDIGARFVLQNSTITRTDAGSTGVWALGGTLISQGSTIVGQDDGLRVRTDKLPSEPVPTFIGSDITLTDGTSVSGVRGSGVFVERGADATIRVLNGSTVKGGNGTLLEVVGNSTVDFSATQAALGGNILVEAGSTVDVALMAGGSLTGAMQGVRGVTFVGGNWTQTASSTVDTHALDQGTVQLGDDASPGDRLVVQGDTAGNTNVRVINVERLRVSLSKRPDGPELQLAI